MPQPKEDKTDTVHGVCIDVFGVGVLLTGPSGIGKSECALDLILRGHRLISDDTVHLCVQSGEVIASGNELTRHHMEVRGLGIINVQDLFGAAAVRNQKRLKLIVELWEWEPGMDFDRTGLNEATQTYVGISISRIRLPIRSGRNIASIVEVAARNHLLKLQGHHSAEIFQASVEAKLREKARTRGTT